MSGFCGLDAVDLIEGYRSGKLDPRAVVEAHLAAIAAQDVALHSFITVAEASARSEAILSHERWLGGHPNGVLDGVPLAIKDNIDVAGMPCTAGVAAFSDRVPGEDAPVVATLRQQGAVILGKLNMHEGALGATTDNPTYGRCMNPVRYGYTPGGSSGGSGAAVAARLCTAALGTDTMGSVRLPASYCGVFGFKPSQGMIPTDGVVPLSRLLDSVGVLARSAADMALVTFALLHPRTQAEVPCGVTLTGLRVGVPRQLSDVAMQPDVAAAFERFVSVLAASGMRIVTLDLRDWRPGAARRAGLLVTEVEAADFYVRALGDELAGLSPSFTAALRHPSRVEPSRIAASYAVIDDIRVACATAFETVELIALPTAPQTSFPHDGPTPTNQAEFTALANFARAPAVSLPFAAPTLPIGMQLMAAAGRDDYLLAVVLGVARVLAQ